MPVYYQDSPLALQDALYSIVNSSVQPDEIIIIEDGDIGQQLEEIILSFSVELPIRTIKISRNVGIGRALAIGIPACRYEWVARFDSDDVCHRLRFERQIEFIKKNNAVDILGTAIAEFDNNYRSPHAYRVLPTKHQDILQYAKFRNPFNHMTVIYRKDKVLEAGNYQDDYMYEDYSLWVRMFHCGAIAANLPDALVYARTGNGMEIRRGGVKYALSEISAQVNFYKIGFINKYQLIKNLAIRIPMRLVSGGIRKHIYRKLLRR